MSNLGELVSPVEALQVTRIVDEKKEIFLCCHSSAPAFIQETTLEPVCCWPRTGFWGGSRGGDRERQEVGCAYTAGGGGTGECCAGVGRRDQA